MNKKICTLPEDINECKYFIREISGCTKENCPYQKEIGNPELPSKYVRKERWYEKYYKDSKPVK